MDTKHYTLLKDGAYAVSRAEWEADAEKRADNFADGISLYIFTEGDYVVGCDYAFSRDKHWYLY